MFPCKAIVLKRLLPVLAAAALLCTAVTAQEVPAGGTEATASVDGSLTVTRITFDGLKRTKESYLQSRVGRFTGGTVAATDLHALETALLMEGLFSDIHAEFAQVSPTEAEIRVALSEKITFIPLPFAMYSNSGFMAGGVVMDTNAFGIKDTFVGGGGFSGTSQMAAAMLSHQERAPVPGLTGVLSFTHGTPKVKDAGNGTVLEYKDIGFSVEAGVSKRLGEHFSASLMGGFTLLSVSDADGHEGCVDSIKMGTATLSLDYSRPGWDGWFMNTTSVGVSAKLGVTDDSDLRFPQTYTAQAAWQAPIVPRLRFYAAASAAYGKDNHVSAYQKQSAASVNLLPSEFATERLGGGNAGVEFAFLRGKYGTVSIYSDYQLAFVRDWNGDWEFVHGPNGGLRVYLAKVAFPALGVDFAYNVPRNYWQFSAAIGMSF